MSVWQYSRDSWEQVTVKVNHAVVFMDSHLAELLHWSGGINVLLTAGARDVREFSSFESSSESEKKAAFLVSTPLSGVTEQIIKDIVTSSHFQYVVVMTTASLQVHAEGQGIEAETCDVFEEFEEEVRGWMGNMNYTAEVMHTPLFCAEVCPSFFIAPAFSDLFPLLASDIRQIAYQFGSTRQGRESRAPSALEEVECDHLPNSLQLQVQLLASGLHSLLCGLGVKEDIYYMGTTSKMVATQLESYPPARARRKTTHNRASLLLFDRSLDVASVVSHQLDTLMDRVTNTLPRLQGHSSDRRLDLQELCQVARGPSATSVILPGSLAASVYNQAPLHLQPLIMKRQKEALMEVNRRLVETASAEKLPLNLSGRPGRITSEQIDSTVALFRGKYQLIRKHLDCLQVAIATSQTLKHGSSGHHDKLLATEKALVQALADEEGGVSPSAAAVLSKLVLQEMGKSQEERTLSVDDLLCLLTYTYAVSDGDCGEEEETTQLRERLTRLILQDKDSLPPLISHIVGDKVNESILSDQLESLWETLVAVGNARSGMQQFRSVLDPGDTMTPASVMPLLRQVMEKVVDPAKPELPDIECKSGGLKDLLKSGFGFFKGSSKPRPGDAPLLVLFVIGGLTAGEVKQVKDVVDKAKPDFQVILGSTRLASVESSLRSVLVADNINFGEL